MTQRLIDIARTGNTRATALLKRDQHREDPARGVFPEGSLL
jgi:hypothetical protein